MSKPSQMNMLINRSQQYRCFCLFKFYHELVNPKHIYLCSYCIGIFSSQNIVERPKGKTPLLRDMGGRDIELK